MSGCETENSARKMDDATQDNAKKDQINAKNSLEKQRKSMKNAWRKQIIRQEEIIAEIVAKCIL